MKDFDIYDLKEFVFKNKDHYETLDRIQMEEDLNRKKYDFVWQVNSIDLMSYFADFADGSEDITRYEKVEEQADSGRGQLKVTCKLLLKIIENARLPLDLSNEKHAKMIDLLVDNNLLSANEKEELYTLASIKISEVEKLFRPGIEINHGHANWLVGALRDKH